MDNQVASLIISCIAIVVSVVLALHIRHKTVGDSRSIEKWKNSTQQVRTSLEYVHSLNDLIKVGENTILTFDDARKIDSSSLIEKISRVLAPELAKDQELQSKLQWMQALEGGWSARGVSDTYMLVRALEAAARARSDDDRDEYESKIDEIHSMVLREISKSIDQKLAYEKFKESIKEFERALKSRI
jgi:hypothetical protein